jgi:Domain of unknown function (DUF4304)
MIERDPNQERRMQAKELFRILLRDQLGPMLRTEGFRGSGPSWRLAHPSGNAALVYFQRARWNTADRVRFTVNLAVASKVVSDWQRGREPWLPAKPSARGVGDCPLWLRIGSVLEGERGDEDRWWTITSGTSLEPVATSVTEALRGKAIPMLREHLTDEALRRWLEDPKERLWPPDVWRLIYLSVLLATQGPSTQLDQVLAQLHARAVRDRRPPWLAEHVTDMRQRAMAPGAGGAPAPTPGAAQR